MFLRVLLALLLSLPLAAGCNLAPTPDGGKGQVTPVVSGELKILFAVETGTQNQLTPDQQAVYSSIDSIAYLDAHCAKDPDGSPGWKRLDPQALKGPWKAIFDAAPPPKVGTSYQSRLYVISGKKIKYADVIPANRAAFLTLIKPYAEPKR